MGILTLLRNAFGRSRKGRTAEAEGATPAPEPQATVPSPSPEPQPTAAAQVPEPRVPEEATRPEAAPKADNTDKSDRTDRTEQSEDGEHELVSAAFDNVTVPKTAEPVAAEEPVAEAAKAETPVAEAAKAEEPVAEAAKAETPVAEAAKAGEPQAETPEPEATKAETPEPEDAKAETPEPEEPVTEAAVAETPAAEEPVTETPAAKEAVQAESVEAEPVEAEPVEAEPVAETPAAEEPAAETPVAEKPVQAEPVAVEAAAEVPVPDEPVAEQEPVAEEPAPVAAGEESAPEPEADPEPEVSTEVTPDPEPVAAEATPEPLAEPVADEPAAADDGEAPQEPLAAEGEGEATPTVPRSLRTAHRAAATALQKLDLSSTRAKVYLVLDRSASMRPYYKDGSAQALGDQTLALAAHLDPEATVHVVFFSTELDGTGELTLTEHENKIDELHASLGRMGRTSYHVAVEEVVTHHRKTAPDTPALVVFQTDGAPDAKTPATQALTEAAKNDPSVFFSFVAFGDPEQKAFDYLRKLKTDNTAHFMAGETPLELTDKQVYEGILTNWRP